MPDAAPPSHCLNCGQAFGAPLPNFCPACGQESRVRAPRLGEFVQQFGGAYFSTEGALWRTLWLLFTKPGELTRQYLAGRRKHYVLPLRLYLTISVVTLLVMRALAAADIDVGPRVGRAKSRPPAVTASAPASAPEVAAEAASSASAASASQRTFRDGLNFTMFGGRAGIRNDVFYCEDLPGWVCKRLKRRMDIDPSAVGTEVEAFKERFVANIGAVMFLMLPTFALFLKLSYRSRRMYYTEHLVFALHTHAFLFVMMALTLPQIGWISGLAFFAAPIYTLLAMRRVYGGRWWPLLLRAMFIGMLYTLALSLALLALSVWTLLF